MCIVLDKFVGNNLIDMHGTSRVEKKSYTLVLVVECTLDKISYLLTYFLTYFLIYLLTYLLSYLLHGAQSFLRS